LIHPLGFDDCAIDRQRSVGPTLDRRSTSKSSNCPPLGFTPRNRAGITRVSLNTNSAGGKSCGKSRTLRIWSGTAGPHFKSSPKKFSTKPNLPP